MSALTAAISWLIWPRRSVTEVSPQSIFASTTSTTEESSKAV